MNPNDPILDWHYNAALPEAMQILAEARVAELLTPKSLDPIYRQLDQAIPTWKVWGPNMGWELLAGDYLYHPNLGTLISAASAYLGQEKIVVYRFALISIIQPNGEFTVGRTS